MSPAEFWKELTNRHPDAVKSVLRGRRLGDVFRTFTMGGTLIEWQTCPLCDCDLDERPGHYLGCPRDFGYGPNVCADGAEEPGYTCWEMRGERESK